MSARRHIVETTAATMTDGTSIELRLFEGGVGPLVRVVANRKLSVVGLWPAADGRESNVEIKIHEPVGAHHAD
jgi:hypothetical protein